MPHISTLVQADTSLYAVAEDGGSDLLTIPSTVTISNLKPPRFDVSGVHAVIVNTPNQPLIVDDNGIVLFLSPLAPTGAPVLVAGAAGSLTGTFGVKYTFAIRKLDGTIVAESGFSPSANVTVTAQLIAASSIQLLPGLTAADYNSRYTVVRRFYRTTTGTSTYFLWYTIADNTTTSFSDGTSDAAINTLAAPSLGTVPYLSHIASFRDRLFGVDDFTNREVLRHSETGLRWAWPTDNTFTTHQVKGDSQSGITTLMPRRDALGIAKSNMLLQLTGSGDDDFRLVTISTTVGCISQESAAVYRDEWYFLGQDGVYKWSEDGLTCLSDGKVRSWFTSSTYFDRAKFTTAFGAIDIARKVYKLFLTAAGASTVKTWVEYDIESGTWWGPHITTGYTFKSAFQLGSHYPLLGEGVTAGFLAVDTDTRSDDVTVAIETSAIMAPIKAVDPPVTAYFGTLTSEVAPQPTGTLSIYPTVGELIDLESEVLSHDLTDASAGLGRLGYGRFLKLRFYHNVLNQIVQLLGFEVDPVYIVGRR